MRKIFFWTIIVFVVVVAAFFVAFASVDSTTPLKIGFIGPLTGSLSNPGIEIKQGFELASLGLKYAVIYEDDMCNPSESTKAAQKLINQDGVDVVVTALCGGSTMAVDAVAKEYNVPVISVASTTPQLSDLGIPRLSSSSDHFADAYISLLSKKGFEKIAVVYENTVYAVGLAKEIANKLGGKVILLEQFQTTEQNVDSQILKVKNSNSQVVFLITQSPVSAALLVKTAYEKGLTLPIFGNEAFFSKTIIKKMMGKAAEGLNLIAYKYNSNSEQMQTFKTKYNSYFGTELVEDLYGAMGYDTFVELDSALADCDKTIKECIQSHFFNSGVKHGLSGDYSFSKKGDTIREFSLWQVQNGEIIPQ